MNMILKFLSNIYCPFGTIRKLKKAIPAIPEKKMKIILEYFLKAIAEFNNKKFNYAEKIMEIYRNNVEYNYFFREDKRSTEEPVLSVVIVAYQAKEELYECLKSLRKQIYNKFEIIVVDNGGNEAVQDVLKSMNIMYIKCPMNLIPSEGRNIGVYFARGEYIAFLDDDAVVPENYTQSIIDAFNKYSILGFRGKVLPKKDNKNNIAKNHYNLGDIPIPSIINTEGNSAFKKSIYQELNGMNPLLFGHEGWEFSYRIMKKYGKYVLIYWPHTIIYHDYASTNSKLNKKNDRHYLMNLYIKKRCPGLNRSRKYFKKLLLDNKSRLKAEKLIQRKE